MLDRNHNSNGNHDGDLISYIYGEMNEQARNAFESHLERCDECALELGAMSDARLGVAEWRRNDFDHLATPEILVPQAEKVRVAVMTREKIGFFAGLAELIGSVSVFTKAGVGLATAALLVASIYFSLPALHSGNEVANEKPKAETQAQPEAGLSNLSQPQKTEISKDTDVKRVEEPSKITKHNVVPSKPVISSRQVAVRVAKDKNLNRLGPEQAKAALRLNSFDEDEDQTLRLSDLFSQVGSGRQ